MGLKDYMTMIIIILMMVIIWPWFWWWWLWSQVPVPVRLVRYKGLKYKTQILFISLKGHLTGALNEMYNLKQILFPVLDPIPWLNEMYNFKRIHFWSWSYPVIRGFVENKWCGKILEGCSNLFRCCWPANYETGKILQKILE